GLHGPAMTPKRRSPSDRLSEPAFCGGGRLRHGPELCACRTCALPSTNRLNPARQEITQLAFARQQSSRWVPQKRDQSRLVRAGSDGNAACAGERLGNLRRKTNMSHIPSGTDNTRCPGAFNEEFGAAARKMQHCVDIA